MGHEPFSLYAILWTVAKELAKMLMELNGYRINTNISMYPNDKALTTGLLAFDNNSYEFTSGQGMKRMFKNEKYFWALNNILFGIKCEAIVAAVDDIIYKISYWQYNIDENISQEFRFQIGNHCMVKMGKNIETRDVAKDLRLVIWDFPEGNVIIEAQGMDSTQIVITSNIVKKAKRLTIFDRFLK